MNSLKIIQIFLSLILICLVLLQAKGAGLASIFGGEGNVFKVRRGAEKGVFALTVIVSILFSALSLFIFLGSAKID